MQKMYFLKLALTISLVFLSAGCDSTDLSTLTYPAGLSSTVKATGVKQKSGISEGSVNATTDITPELCDLYIALSESEQFSNISLPSFCPSKRYSIGDTGPSGGIVFHVTDGGLHGLEARRGGNSEKGNVGGGLNDGQYAYWYSFSKCRQFVFNSDKTDFANGAGIENTGKILAGCGSSSSPAHAAANYIHRIYENSVPVSETDGWHLPSKDELSLAFKVQSQGVASTRGRSLVWRHWSSSISGDGKVWAQSVSQKDVRSEKNKNSLLRVRLIKAF